MWTKRSIWQRRSTKGWTPRLESLDASRAQCLYWKDLTCSGNKRGCQPHGKLMFFNAVCVSKLLYSLEALQPTEATASKLDTFQLKGLRKILHMHKTYIERANTNNEVYRRANLEMGPGAEEIIRPLSDILQEKRRKVLGHIIRRTRNHQQHQATFAAKIFCRNKLKIEGWVAQERSGHMKQYIPFQIQNREPREQIKTWATNREDLFDKL